MKKRVLLGLLGTILAAGLLMGCNKSEQEETKQAEEAEETESTGPVMPSVADIDLAAAVKLGDYKGIVLEKEITEVTEESIDTEITYALSSTPMEVSDENAKVEEGDTVNIDYVGKIDGEEFEGGSAEGSDLTIGSGQFIEGFEDGLVGTTKGQTVDLNLTFPEDYSEELSGKDVVFTVTINAIKRPAAEISDDWVAANSEYSTVQEYRDSVRKDLEDYYASEAEEQLQAVAWQQVVSGSEILEYPEELVTYGEDVYDSQIEMYASYSGQTLEEYVEAQGMSQEEYRTQKEEYGKNVAAQMLVMQAVANAEGFTTEDQEYQDSLNEYVEQYGMESADELYEQYGEQNVYQSIMLARVCRFIVDNAEIREVAAPTAESTEGAEDATAEAGEIAEETSEEPAEN